MPRSRLCAASRRAMALRGQLRGDSEGGPAAEVLARRTRAGEQIWRSERG
jgi:hypothetical protein